jgi:asparagine synthase (glutamine-hydrolysing)
MCGIAGVFYRQSHEEIRGMLHNIRHRGPDGEGIKDLARGTLGHTRLAIIDIESGHQPMSVGDAWIVFNGEIYNFRELAHTHLEGQSLDTHSDTEVLLRLYLKYGSKCVELLRGMFAFAIMNGDDFFLARDPLGIKPLYCGNGENGFYFASEIKALAVATSEIYEFPAGCWYHSRKGWHTYYEVASTPSEMNSEEEAIQSIHTTIQDAVRLRMIADVPVGISLSGGLDSSIVAMLASRETKHLHSFAVGMNGSEDLKAAQLMAKALETRHHERIYTEEEMLAVLPKVIYHLESFDSALVRSAIPNYFLAELASQYVKVILTGEGADEIYAGYEYLSSYSFPQKLQEEMVDITAALHNTNLQRADRIPMAFGLEARVPFLDVRSVALGLSLPAEWKFHNDKPAKFLLRQAFAADLPGEIVNRPKQKFSVGAGSSNVFARRADREISDAEFQTEFGRLLSRWDYELPNKEALLYYRILRNYYEDRWIFPSMGQSRSL